VTKSMIPMGFDLRGNSFKFFRNSGKFWKFSEILKKNFSEFLIWLFMLGGFWESSDTRIRYPNRILWIAGLF